MWNTGQIQIQAIVYIFAYIHKYIQNNYSKVGLVEEINRGGKEGKKVNNKYITSVKEQDKRKHTEPVKQCRMGKG
jgi:hypothetical protein